MTEKKKVGRPKGLPRTGGRQPGTPNRVNQVTRDFIISHGTPIETLCKIAKGLKLKAAAADEATKSQCIFPTLDQRLTAARILASKVMPDMKAVAVSTDQGVPLVFSINLDSSR